MGEATRSYLKIAAVTEPNLISADRSSAAESCGGGSTSLMTHLIRQLLTAWDCGKLKSETELDPPISMRVQLERLKRRQIAS